MGLRVYPGTPRQDSPVRAPSLRTYDPDAMTAVEFKAHFGYEKPSAEMSCGDCGLTHVQLRQTRWPTDGERQAAIDAVKLFGGTVEGQLAAIQREKERQRR
jgi:hypothetical protein